MWCMPACDAASLKDEQHFPYCGEQDQQDDDDAIA